MTHAQTLAKGTDLVQESADAAELRLLEQDEFVDVRIVLKDRVRRRLDHPCQMCVGILLLDGI